MQPTFWSSVEFYEDKPYYFVLFFTAVVYFGYTTVLVNTPHDVVWHLVFNVLHIAMHITWQMTKRTDPGTIGLQDKGIYQSQYVQAIDEMCVTASSFAKVHAVSVVYVVLLLTCLPLLCGCVSTLSQVQNREDGTNWNQTDFFAL